MMLNLKIVSVPGNHDCCFDNEKKTRKSILNDCKTDIVDEEDYFIDAMAGQSNFWDFTNEITDLKERNKVSYKYEFIPSLDFKVSFHCYNTSWLTEINEKQGSLTVPENKFIENEKLRRNEILIIRNPEKLYKQLIFLLLRQLLIL